MIYEVTVLCFSQETFSQPQGNQRPHPSPEPRPSRAPATPGVPAAACPQSPPHLWEGGAEEGGTHLSQRAPVYPGLQEHLTSSPVTTQPVAKLKKKKTGKSPSRNINPQVFMLVFCHMKWHWKPRVRVPSTWKNFAHQNLSSEWWMISADIGQTWVNRDWRHFYFRLGEIHSFP